MCALQKHPVSWLHLQLPQHDAAFLTFCFYTSTISKWLKLSWWPCWCFSLKKEQPFVMDCHQGMRDSQADRFQAALMGDTRPRWTPELRSSTGFSSQENTKSFALHQGLLTEWASRKPLLILMQIWEFFTSRMVIANLRAVLLMIIGWGSHCSVLKTSPHIAVILPWTETLFKEHYCFISFLVFFNSVQRKRLAFWVPDPRV